MKILFVRVSAIGDVVHTIPAAFLIKKMVPSAQISWVVQSKAAGILEKQPFLDKIWTVPDKFWAFKHFSEMYSILKDIQSEQWDAIIDFQGILKTSLLLACIKGKKYGFSFEHARSWQTTWLTHHHTEPEYSNIIQKNLALASSVACDLGGEKSCPSIDALASEIYLNIPEASKLTVDSWGHANGIKNMILLAPNTTWPSKMWPDRCWQELVVLLEKNREKLGQDFTVAVVGKNFGMQASNLVKFCETKKLKVLTVPGWDLLTLAYLIKKSSLIVAPDTGLLHVADLLNCRAIGIFGPTNKLKHGPLLTRVNVENAIQVECSHYYQKTHGKNQNDSESSNCMYKLLPELLFEKIFKNLN